MENVLPSDTAEAALSLAATQPRSLAATLPRSHPASQPRSHPASQPRSRHAPVGQSHSEKAENQMNREHVMEEASLAQTKPTVLRRQLAPAEKSKVCRCNLLSASPDWEKHTKKSS